MRLVFIGVQTKVTKIIKKFLKLNYKYVAGIVLVILGLLLIFLGSKEYLRIFLTTSFRQEPVSTVGFESKINTKNPPVQILIPELKIDLPVKKAEIVDGYWEVFPDSAGWGDGSGYPGESGNQVIFAHARWGLFLPLRKAKVDMEIVVKTNSSEFRYRIKEIKEVFPNEVGVISPTNDETLTLYTCSGFNDNKRLIVIAKPIS